MDGANGHATSESARVGSAGERTRDSDYGDVSVGTVTPVPASISKAICEVQATVEAVKKSHFNKHGGYNFASADDIYAALARKLGTVGLVILPLELSHEVKSSKVDAFDRDGKRAGEKTVNWIKITFGFLFSCGPDTWFDDRARRSLLIQYTGPQTYNAAEAYVQKQFLRGLFKLPTGDMDLDAMPQAETEEAQVSLAGNSGVKRKSSSAAKKDGTSTPLFNEIKSEIANARNAEHLEHIREVRMDEWDAMPARWADLLNEEYEVKMDGFRK